MGYSEALHQRLREVLTDVAIKVTRHHVLGDTRQALRARSVTAPDLVARISGDIVDSNSPLTNGHVPRSPAMPPGGLSSGRSPAAHAAGSWGVRQRSHSFQSGGRVQVLDMARLRKFWFQCKVQMAMLKDMLHPLDPHAVYTLGMEAFAKQAFSKELLQQICGYDHLPGHVIQDQKKILDQLTEDCRHCCGAGCVDALLTLRASLEAVIQASGTSKFWAPEASPYVHPDAWGYDYDEQDYDVDLDDADGDFAELDSPEDYVFAPLLLVNDSGGLTQMQSHLDREDGEAPSSRYAEDFEEVGVLGAGAGGVVCLAHHKEEGRLYAVKKIVLDDNDRRTRRLWLEAKIMEALTWDVNEGCHEGCRHVVTYFDSWEDPFDARTAKQFACAGGPGLSDAGGSDASTASSNTPPHPGRPRGVLCIQMEYCESGSLRKFLGILPETLDVAAVLSRFAQIVDGVSYVHQQKFVHLDIKPENIFVSREEGATGAGPQEVMKVGDFGLSCSIGTVSGAGTVPYASPEVRKGAAVDQKADVYSLGVVLLECFARWQSFAERSRALDPFQATPSLATAPQGLAQRYPHVMELVVDMVQLASWKRPSLARVRARLRDLIRQCSAAPLATHKRARSPKFSLASREHLAAAIPGAPVYLDQPV